MAEQKKSCGGWFPIVVILLIGALLFLSTAQFGNRCTTTRESEVKQNLHAIQLALERYAVDHDGSYPIYIMGGDWTDSYVVAQSWSEYNELDDPDVVFAPPGMGDALIMESYMPVYPQNPFKKVSKLKLPTLLKHCNYKGEVIARQIGGTDGTAMVEVFGPTAVGNLQKNQEVVGDFFVHHIFNDPPYDIIDMRKENGVDWNKPSGNELLVGNFSYYPHAKHYVCWNSVSPEPAFKPLQSYTLAGYGSLKTAGQDVYNRNGNYKGRYRTERCMPYDCWPVLSLYPNDIPCICPDDGDLEPTMYQNNGGSDTLPDGVVLTLDGGGRYQRSKVNFDKTERN